MMFYSQALSPGSCSSPGLAILKQRFSNRKQGTDFAR